MKNTSKQQWQTQLDSCSANAQTRNDKTVAQGLAIARTTKQKQTKL
jgi:hypothetical protein